MADCPVCNSRLYTQRRLPNIFKKRFICLACGWKKNVEDVHKEGTMDNVKAGLNKHSNSHKHRHHRRHHRRRKK